MRRGYQLAWALFYVVLACNAAVMALDLAAWAIDVYLAWRFGR